MKKIVTKIFTTMMIITFITMLCLMLTTAFKVAVVSGSSMDPTLKDGDVLIVYALGQPDDKDIVILNTEGTGLDAEYIIKRCYEDKSTDKRIWLEGDNKDNSLDSRKLGTFKKDEVIGTAIFDITQMKGL